MPEKLEYMFGGNEDSTDLVVFLQGWPDNWQMWDWINWKEQLKNQKLLFINFPNTTDKITHKWGMDFPQIVENLKYTIDNAEGLQKIQKKILVAHDWGCVYGYMFDQKYPEFFNQMIVLDVPGIVQPKKDKTLIFIILYQVYLAVAFLIGGKIGAYMTKKMCTWFRHSPPYFEDITGARNYPYYYSWKNLLLSTVKLAKPNLKRYRPSVPTVYLYAAKKPFQFHGQKWMSLFSNNRENHYEVHEVQAGHWFMKNYPKFLTDLIIRRVKARL